MSTINKDEYSTYCGMDVSEFFDRYCVYKVGDGGVSGKCPFAGLPCLKSISPNNKPKYCAFLRYDNSTHLDQTIGSALVGITTILFCRIYTENDYQLNFQNNQGMSSTVSLTTQEIEHPMILGVNNSQGIIVGYGFGGFFYCYDAVCPNCHEHVLSMDANGIATCPNCGHQYDMTNNGLSPQGGTLVRYHATVSPNHLFLLVTSEY